MLDKRLDRALKFQREQNGHEEETSVKEREDRDYLPEKAEPEEKVGFKEFMLMTLSAWGILLPVCLAVLIIMVLIARLLFRV
ncbi:MAG: hypothetical protein IK016_08135 [Lachnospiraceae bacterium]|nr:hypothetical protein [Lachnospiraceae bacterium]